MSKKSEMALKFTDKLKNLELPKVSVKDEAIEKLTAKTHELQEKVSAFLEENSEKLKQWYSDNQMEEKIKTAAKKAGSVIIYPVLLLYNVLNSPHVASKDKLLIIAPLAYFIMPADLVPDFLLGAGYMDDGVAVMTALQAVSSSITPAIKDQAKQMCVRIFGEIDDAVVDSVLSKIVKDKEAEV